MPGARAESLKNLARVVARGEIDLGPGADAAATIERLVALPGIGPWTAEYIALRALGWPDAFPAGDLGLRRATGLRKATGLASARELADAAKRWRPWRGYAAMHLWESLGEVGSERRRSGKK
jgi:AraC family transcriptional regulator of adaptative response / DNA-3-methyladenine glycosylase II